MALCTALIFLESTILPIALPTIQRELNIDQDGLYWIINAYLLVLACLVYVGGKLSDFFGAKKIFVLGLMVFSIATIGGALSIGKVTLIVSRTVMGLGSALMLPSSMSITLHSLNKHERGKGIGSLVAVGSIFLTLGPFLGGYLTQYFTWRYIFWINLPVIFASLILAIVFVPKYNLKAIEFNFSGFVVYLGGLISLTLAIMQIKVYGLFSIQILSCFSVFLFFIALFVYQLKRQTHTFFDYKLFKIPRFQGGMILIFIAQFLIMMTVFWSLYFQKILGLSPIESGKLLLIPSIPVIFCAPLSGYMSDRFGPRWPIVIGYGLTTLSFAWILVFPFFDKTALSIFGLLFFGIGISLVMTPIGTSLLSAVSEHKRGIASGMYSTARNIASTFSVAILGSLVSYVIHLRFKFHMQGSLFGDPKMYKNYVLDFLQGKSLAAAFPKLSPTSIESIEAIVRQSSVRGFFALHILCLSLSFLAFLLAFFYFRNKGDCSINNTTNN